MSGLQVRRKGAVNVSKRLLTRAEVPEELTWDLTDLFPSPEAWEAEMKSLSTAIPKLGGYRGRLGEGADVFRQCIELQEELTVRAMRAGSYAWLLAAADGTCQKNQIAAGRVQALAARFQAETAFVRPEALNLPDGLLMKYLDEDPELDSLRPAIEQMLELKPYTLDIGTETALAALSEVLGAPGNVYRRSKTTDMRFEDVEDGAGNTVPLSFPAYEGRHETAPDPVLRRNAFAAFTEGLKPYQNTYAALWGTEVQKNVVEARLRGYGSATEMMLTGQRIPVDVYNNLHDVILTELAPHMRRYAKLRKRVLGLDSLFYCDIEAPLDPDFTPQTTFADASELILKGLEVLGPEYTQIMSDGLGNRWVDLAENVGKSTGAFCNSVPGVHPYILVTWTDSMRDALVLAHELGHAGQGVLSQRYQRPANTRPSMFFIEAPSTINELLVANHILDQTDDVRMKRWLIMQLLMTYHHNFVRHLIEGELQRRIYAVAQQGMPVTAGMLSKTQAEILEEFWGGEVTVDEGASLTWMRQPHYYMGLYPYSYSAGLTIGTAVSRAIREQGKAVAENWIEVLKAGGTRRPLDLAQMAGVDMSGVGPIRDAVAYVGSLVEEVEQSF